jgi:endogenous inhibitor of DNA gyrase (YacG/DUF329 family)
MEPRKRTTRPSLRETANQMVCPNCGGEVKRKSPHGPRPVYCSTECRKAKGNRDLARGSVIVTLAQAWRINRGSGEVAQEAFKEFVSILDKFNDEDRAEGRPRADIAAAKLLDSGYRYIDRKRT